MKRRSKRGSVGLGHEVRPSEPPASSAEGEADRPMKSDRPRKMSYTRTLNTRFLVMSLLLMLLAGAGIFGLHYLQQTRLTDKLLSRAEAAVEGEPEEAERRYREYLQFRPDDLEVRLKLARLQMESADSAGEWVAAYRTNEQILRANPTQNSIRRDQVDVIFRLGRWRDARVHLETLLEADPTDGALHMLLAIASEAQREFRSAEREYELAIEHGFPSVRVLEQELTAVDAYAKLARILREESGKPREADQMYRDLVRAHPESSAAYLRRALYRRQYGLIQDAVEDARHAMELAPDDLDACLVAAELALAAKSPEEELKSLHDRLESLVDSHPDDARVYHMLAVFARRQGETDQAINTLEEGIEQSGEDSSLIALLISDLLDQGDIKGAREQLERLQSQEGSEDRESPLLDYLEGSVLLQAGQPRDALDKLRSARTKSLTNPTVSLTNLTVSQLASLQVGRCYLAMGLAERALAEFRSVQQDNPESVEAQRGVALALMATGDDSEAVRILRDFPSGNIQAAVELAQLELRVVLRRPAEQRNWKAVESAVQKARVIEPDSPDVCLVQATMLLAQGQTDEARTVLKTASESSPDDPRITTGLARLALLEQNFEMARGVLEEFEADNRRHPEIDATWLQYWRQADENEFRRLLEEIEQREYPDHPAAWSSLRAIVAAAYAELGDQAGRLRVMKAIADSQPDQVENWFRLLGMALEVGDDDIRADAMKNLLQIDGEDGSYMRCAKAMCLIQDAEKGGDESSLADAQKLLTDLASERSDWLPPLILLGQLAVQADQREKAVDWFQQAILNGHRDIATLRLTANLLIDLEQPQDAIKLFERIRSESTGQLRNNLNLLTFQLQASQDQTGEFLRKSVPALLKNMSDAGSGLARGQLLWAKGQLDDAEAVFREVAAANPSQPTGWLVLIDFLSRRGDSAGATKVLAEAEPGLRQSGEMIALAGCYELSGDRERAEQELQTLTEVEPDNAAARVALASLHVRSGQPDKVESLLRPLLDATDQSGSVNLTTVRRLLATSIAFTSFAKFEEALRLVQENIDVSVERSTDERLKARLLIGHTHPDFVQEGLRLFDMVAKKVALNVTEELLLAQAYDRMEEYAAADRAWAKLLDEHASDARVIEATVRRQLQRNPEGDSTADVGKLLRLIPNGASGVELNSRIDVRNGDVDQAIARLREFCDTAEEAEQQQRILQVAGWLADIASSTFVDSDIRDRLFREADSLLQPLASSTAAAAMQRASLLSQEGRLSDALDQLEQVQPPLSEMQKVASGVNCIQFVDHANPAVRRVEEWADAMYTDSPNTMLAIHFKEAVCRRLGQYDLATKLNHQILEMDPDQVAALNNLAWLLATQEGNHAKALDLVKDAIKKSGPFFFLLDTRGLIYLETGQIKEAIKDFETSWLQRNLPVTKFHLARALAQSGEAAAAEEQLSEAIDRGLQTSMLEVAEVPLLKRLCSTFELQIPDR